MYALIIFKKYNNIGVKIIRSSKFWADHEIKTLSGIFDFESFSLKARLNWEGY